MSSPVLTFTRAGTWALPVWAGLLFLGTLTHQPDPASAFGDFAEYVTTPWFLVSHLANSIAGAAIGSLGAVALAMHLQDDRALAGMAMSVAGNVILSSVFGVAAFAQPAMGRAFLAGQPHVPALYGDMYAVPLFATAAIGLLLFMAGGVLLGMAIVRARRWPVWVGRTYAAATVTFAIGGFALPASQPVSALLLFIATGWLAWRSRSSA